MAARNRALPAAELEIMRIVWERGSGTVRGVNAEHLKRRKIASTSVMTTMGILEGKGY